MVKDVGCALLDVAYERKYLLVVLVALGGFVCIEKDQSSEFSRLEQRTVEILHVVGCASAIVDVSAVLSEGPLERRVVVLYLPREVGIVRLLLEFRA